MTEGDIEEMERRERQKLVCGVMTFMPYFIRPLFLVDFDIIIKNDFFLAFLLKRRPDPL